MKTLVLGDITAEGYNVVGKCESVPEVIGRLAQRDIKVVLVSNEVLKEYNEHELEMLTDTFRRYGARLECEEQ